MNVNSKYNSQQDVYDVIKELLPQLQAQLRTELETKYLKMFNDKENQVRREFEQMYSKKLQKSLHQQEQRLQYGFEKRLEQKARKQDRKKEEGMERQIGEMKQKINQLEKQIQVLYQQRSNWTKLQKGYQQALKDLSQENTMNSNVSVMRGRSNTDKEFLNFDVMRQSNPTPLSSISKNRTQLSIQTQNLKQMTIGIPALKTSSTLLYQTDQTQQNQSEVRGILSPPSVDPDLIDSVLQLNSKAKQTKKQVFWNQQKKMQLLKMIRHRIN